VEVDNERADSKPKGEGTIAMQKYSNKQATRFRVAHTRLLLQVSSNFQNFVTSPSIYHSFH